MLYVEKVNLVIISPETCNKTPLYVIEFPSSHYFTWYVQ